MVSKVEGHVAWRLRYWDDVLTEGMGDAGFIEYIRIPAGEIANDSIGSKNQRKNVLYKDGVLPHIVNAVASQSVKSARCLDCFIDYLVLSGKGHHYCHERLINSLHGNFEY